MVFCCFSRCFVVCLLNYLTNDISFEIITAECKFCHLVTLMRVFLRKLWRKFFSLLEIYKKNNIQQLICCYFSWSLLIFLEKIIFAKLKRLFRFFILITFNPHDLRFWKLRNRWQVLTTRLSSKSLHKEN